MMAKKKVLVPYNFTDYDEKALDLVIRRFADDENVEVTLFNAFVPVPEIDVRNNPIMEKMSRNLGHLQQIIYEREADIKQARNKLIQNGFSDERVHYIYKALKRDAAHDIIDLAREGRFAEVILNHNPSRITRFFTGSVSAKVMKNLKEAAVYLVK
jgi:hypothetical protein